MSESTLIPIIRKLKFMLSTHIGFVLTLDEDIIRGVKTVDFPGDEKIKSKYLEEVSFVIDYEAKSLSPVLEEFYTIFLQTDSKTLEKMEKEVKCLYDRLHGLNDRLLSFSNGLVEKGFLAPRFESSVTDYSTLLATYAGFLYKVCGPEIGMRNIKVFFPREFLFPED